MNCRRSFSGPAGLKSDLKNAKGLENERGLEILETIVAKRPF